MASSNLSQLICHASRLVGTGKMCGWPHNVDWRNQVFWGVAELTPNDRTQERCRPATDVPAQSAGPVAGAVRREMPVGGLGCEPGHRRTDRTPNSPRDGPRTDNPCQRVAGTCRIAALETAAEVDSFALVIELSSVQSFSFTA